jgi:hypothetical protein
LSVLDKILGEVYCSLRLLGMSFKLLEEIGQVGEKTGPIDCPCRPVADKAIL